MDLDQLDDVLLIGSVVVLAAVFGVRLATRIGVPGLLLYLGIGMLLGESGIGVEFDDAQLATVLGYGALVIILAEGGITTRLSVVRPVLGPSLVLATVGVGISIALVAVPLHLILGTDWRTALLLGAVLAPTDAAAVFSVARRMRLTARPQSILEAESGFNDAPVVVLVAVLASASFADTPWWEIPLIVFAELVGGVAVGVAVGLAARWVLPRLALPASGLYPIAVMALIAASYGLAGLIHSSGFMAVYLSALLIGSTSLPHRRTVIGFIEGLAWVAQIGLFVMLGLLVSPDELGSALLVALVAGVALLVLGRPVSVFLSLIPFRIPLPVMAFLSWAGLRGAVPIIFAAIPLGEGTPGGNLVFNATFVLVVVLTLIQTPTLPWLAARLRVQEVGRADELEVDAAPLDEMRATLLGVDIGPGSKLAGTYVVDLHLPVGAVVSLVVRDGAGSVPDNNTRLRSGDRLLVVATAEVREVAEARLRAISRGGRMAGWGQAPEP